MKKYLIFIFIVIELSSFAQKSPNQNINLRVGIGQPSGYSNFDTYGLTYSIGYERQILKKIISKDLLRINPSLNFGHFSSDKINYAISNHNYSSYEQRSVNSFILDTRINFDVVQIKSFSIVVSSGIFLGIRNTTYNSSPNISSNIHSKYRYGNFGGLYAFGIRFNSLKDRLGFNIIRTNYIDLFKEHNIMLGVEYKL